MDTFVPSTVFVAKNLFLIMKISLLQLAVIAAETADSAVKTAPAFSPAEIVAPFLEQFTADWNDRWKRSTATKADENNAEDKQLLSYSGTWIVEEAQTVLIPGDER